MCGPSRFLVVEPIELLIGEEEFVFDGPVIDHGPEWFVIEKQSREPEKRSVITPSDDTAVRMCWRGEVVQPCRLTIALIQIGAKGEVQPLETG